MNRAVHAAQHDAAGWNKLHSHKAPSHTQANRFVRRCVDEPRSLVHCSSYLMITQLQLAQHAL